MCGPGEDDFLYDNAGARRTSVDQVCSFEMVVNTGVERDAMWDYTKVFRDTSVFGGVLLYVATDCSPPR